MGMDLVMNRLAQSSLQICPLHLLSSISNAVRSTCFDSHNGKSYREWIPDRHSYDIRFINLYSNAFCSATYDR